MSLKDSLALLIPLAIVGIAGRLIPHLPNMAPVTAAALFASAYWGARYSIPATLAIMLAGDAIIGFYSLPVMASVYGSFIAIAIMGTVLRGRRRPAPVLAAAAGSSLLFFLVTNWAVWQFGSMYDHSIHGLIQSYAMGLPFFRNALMGDLFFSASLFGAADILPRMIQRAGARFAHGSSSASFAKARTKDIL